MFSLTYVLRELRRRLGRTLLTATGLAVGVGLVIGITGLSQGLDDAQHDVLAPLGSVGTDLLVTRVAGTSSSSSSQPSDAPSAQPGRSGGGFFGPGRGGQGELLDDADAAALLNENSNVVTDLAKLGKPGEKFTRDFFLSATLISFPASAIDEIEKLPGVSAAVGGLVQLVQHQTGTVPEIVAQIQTGGQTITSTTRPEPMSEAERDAFRTCLEKKGVTIGQPRPAPTGSPGGGGTIMRGGPAFDDCLPKRFREYTANVIVPMQTIRQIVQPPSTDITNTSYTAAGVDPADSSVGLVTAEQLTEGRWLAAADEVLLNVAYANTKSLKVGSTLPINGTTYEVVGLVNPTLTGSTADVYFSLATLQKLAGKSDRVTQVLVKAESADDVGALAKRIEELLPGATVVTTQALADQVTGSLADADQIASRLGGALAAIVLLSAFAIAVLLTLSSIGKRVREIGTLRAIGWSKGRVVRQLLGETLAIGLLGGLLGVAAGVGVAQAAEAVSPTLSATSSGVPGIGSSSLSSLFGQAAAGPQTTSVALTAPLSAGTLLTGVAFALLGGLLAGLAGGWRAARLSPAVALRDLG